MFRTPVLSALVLLTLACARAPTIEPTSQAATVHDERAAVQAAAARAEQLTAWIGENDEGERYAVPVSDADVTFGAGPGARVTFVVFLDYQCPYSRGLDEELHALVETYPTDVRVVVKQFPLAMHPRARVAAEAVLAAAAQGRGLAMHEQLYAEYSKLTDDVLRGLAGAAQVPDLDRFWSEVTQGTYAKQVDADIELAGKLAVTSTPSYFVNGTPQRGKKSYEQLREMYVAQLEVVEGLIAAGATRDESYGLLMAAAKPEREPPPKPQPNRRPGRPDPTLHYAVPVDGRPARGPDDALVTIIEFADFQCPYSKRVQATLAALERQYGEDLRIVYRHQPLPMHKAAEPAALAAVAADRQGEFWAMHDALFAIAGDLSSGEQQYLDLAAQLGLDIAQFEADMRDPASAEAVAADQQIAAQFGAGGTPAFFINGRFLSGAQTIEAFETLIDQELAAARAYAREHGVARDELYTTMSAHWETEVEPPPLAEHERHAIDLKDLPGKGELGNPAITLVMCGDFDCPYTARGAQLVEQILAADSYEDKVGFYFMHFPLPMHKDAMGAHQAAIAAGNQGKFWEMHDLLFADRKRRGRAEFAAMAAELQLDVDQFLADWASAATQRIVDEHKDACAKLGVTGTPTFFVNGRSMRGALPFEMASEVLDEELAGGFEAK